MKLVTDWRKCWKWFSIQAMIAAGSIQAAWVSLPSDLRDSVPDYLVTWGTITILALGVIGRVVSQAKE